MNQLQLISSNEKPRSLAASEWKPLKSHGGQGRRILSYWVSVLNFSGAKLLLHIGRVFQGVQLVSHGVGPRTQFRFPEVFCSGGEWEPVFKISPVICFFLKIKAFSLISNEPQYRHDKQKPL